MSAWVRIITKMMKISFLISARFGASQMLIFSADNS